LLAIRWQVFVREQGVPEDEELDGQDIGAVHLIAETHSGAAVGTARILPTGQIGRMAVLREHRGRGVGQALLKAALATIAEQGWPRPFLNAQTGALGFYRRAGFVSQGAEFLDAGISHRRMVLVSPAVSNPDR
jgi:predicted GNAT family N-acyltransferase